MHQDSAFVTAQTYFESIGSMMENIVIFQSSIYHFQPCFSKESFLSDA